MQLLSTTVPKINSQGCLDIIRNWAFLHKSSRVYILLTLKNEPDRGRGSLYFGGEEKEKREDECEIKIKEIYFRPKKSDLVWFGSCDCSVEHAHSTNARVEGYPHCTHKKRRRLRNLLLL
jgi:hypothetical protein